MRIFFWFLIISLVVSKKGYSQNRYVDGSIVLNNSDTIQAKINSSSLAKNECAYLDTSGNELTADPMKVKSLSLVNGKQYCVKHFNNKNEIIDGFFEQLVKGRISLYSYKRRYFVQKENNELLELRKYEVTTLDNNNREMQVSKNEYIGILKYLLSDSNNSLPELNHLYFDVNEFIKYIRIYNEGEKYIEEIRSKRFKPKFLFGVEASYTFANYAFILSDTKIDGRFASPGIVSMIKCQFSKNMNASAGLDYSFLKFNLYQSDAKNGNKNFYSLNNQFGILSLPVFLNYEFRKLPLCPYIGLGSSYQKTIVENFTYLVESSSGASNINSKEYKTQFGGNGSANYMIAIGCSTAGKGVQYGLNIKYAKQFLGFDNVAKDHISQKSALKIAFSILF